MATLRANYRLVDARSPFKEEGATFEVWARGNLRDLEKEIIDIDGVDNTIRSHSGLAIGIIASPLYDWFELRNEILEILERIYGDQHET